MRNRVASLVVAVMVAGTFQLVSPSPSSGADGPFVPSVQKTRVVPHTVLKKQRVRTTPPSVPAALKQRGALPERWSSIQSATSTSSTRVETVKQRGGWKGRPLLQVTDAPRGGQLRGTYGVRLADPATVEKLGARGLVFEVQAQTGSNRTAEMQLNYADLIKLQGLDWASRLQLATLPACALTTPELAACQQPTPLKTVHDSTARTASAQLSSITTTDAATLRSASKTSAVDGAGAKQAAPAATVVMAAAGPGGSQGTYLASSLSASGSWSQGGASGTFGWSYPISTTQPAAGDAPAVGLSYSSTAVDGFNSNSNPQSSWVGAGFDYQPGYIEQTFRNCKEATPSSTDKGLCWAGDLLTLHMPGGGTQALVVDTATGRIRPEGDSGERVERLNGASNGSKNGEYWRVTTTDGTRFTFGLNKLPGAAATTVTNSAWNVPVAGGPDADTCAAKRCVRTWRWNLDMVEDVHDNVSAYYYAKETNYFVPSGGTTRVSYDRGGYPTRIDYGIVKSGGSIYTNANPPNRINFSVEERCKPTSTITCTPAQFTTANSSAWPDVPVDQSCGSTGTCAINWPTFWTRIRLARITSTYFTGSAYATVDDYKLTYKWSTGSSSALLELASIQRTATAGGSTIALPAVTFDYVVLFNRVRSYKGLPDMGYDRLTRIVSETGSETRITYSTQLERYDTNTRSCVAATVPSEPSDNNTDCFPINWVQPFQTTATLDYFHKYPVVAVEEFDAAALTPMRHTEYKYSSPAWHFDDNEVVKPAQRTWSQWRGYRTVETLSGDNETGTINGGTDQQSRSVTTYYQGMDGDRLPGGNKRSITFDDSKGSQRTDSDDFAGMLAETRTFDGATEVSSTRSWPTAPVVTGVRARTDLHDLRATAVDTARTVTTTNATGGSTTDLITTSTTDFETASTTEPWVRRPASTTTTSSGGTGPNPGTCTRYSYADNATTWVRNMPAESSTYATGCGGGNRLLSSSRVYYDNKTAVGGGNVTLGDATKTETAVTSTDSGLRYATAATAYDARGRITSATTYPDGVAAPGTARTTSTAYALTGGILTGTTTTLPAMNGVTGATTTTQTLDPARGVVTRSTDIAGRITSATIDALGRYTAVWKPGRVQGSVPASVTYAYKTTPGAPLAVTTKTLVDVGGGSTPAYDTSISLHDSRGVLRQTQADTTEGARVVSDSYVDSHGWVIRTNAPWYTSGAPSTTVVATGERNLDARTITRYDRVGRPVLVQNWRRDETTPVDSTTTIYQGDRTTVIPPSGATATTTLVNGAGTTTELRRYTEPVTQATYGSASYNRTAYSPGANGQLDSFTTAAGTPQAATWSYDYDLLGRRVKSDDPDSGVSQTTYDDTDAVTSTTDAADRTTSTVYDAWGRPTARYIGTPSSGTKTGAWAYDSLVKGELTSATTYSKDAVTGADRTFTKTITGYTAEGLPTGQDLSLDLPGFLPKYLTRTDYTSTGLISSMVMGPTRDTTIGQGNASEVLNYRYNRLGQQTSLTGTNSYLVNAVYTPFREASQYVMGGGSFTTALTYTRDPHHRWITNTLMTGQLAQPQVASVSADYDAAGNTTRVVDVQGPPGSATQTTCYRYDALRQLTDAWAATDACEASPDQAPIGGVNPFRESWTFDAAGSRTSQTLFALPGTGGADVVTTYANGTADQAHAMASAATQGEARASVTGVVAAVPSSVSASYSAAGETESLTSPAGQTRLAYRGDGSLSTVTTEDGATSEYVTDVDGARLLRVDRDGDAVRTTLYLPGQQVQVAVSGGVRSITTNRFYSLASGVQVAARKNNTNPVFTLADPHGTVSMTYQPFTSPTSPSVVRRGFDPYGNALSTTDPDGAGGSGASGTPAAPGWVDDRGFLNKPVNPESGLVDLQARQYDPASGRFLSVDPLLDPASPLQANGYNYANNNPLTYSDPTGHYPVCGGEQCAGAVPDSKKPGGWDYSKVSKATKNIRESAARDNRAAHNFAIAHDEWLNERNNTGFCQRGACNLAPIYEEWIESVRWRPWSKLNSFETAAKKEWLHFYEGVYEDGVVDAVIATIGTVGLSVIGSGLKSAAIKILTSRAAGSGATANAAPKALSGGPRLTAQWGAGTYRHGGLMSTIEHINYRHAYGSGFSNVSRYAQGTSARDIKGYVDYVLRNGTVTDRGMIGNVGRTIGTDRVGNPVSGLEVIVRDGMIKTAYPVSWP